MKAYEALALGRHLIRAKGGVVLQDYVNGQGKLEQEGCALGMIQKAAGDKDGTRLRKWLLDTHAICPCGCYLNNPMKIQDSVVHLFDRHIMGLYPSPKYTPWTLEKLIDWLRTQEPETKVEETNECTEENRALVAHS